MSKSSPPNSRPIVLRGCRQHSLKGFDLEIPRGRYVAVTGPSGSGKSSLAFDTLFAEGQRRYVESFSAYARQFLERMNRPALDGLEGIPPAVAIEQGNTVRSSRSSVGTITEIHDFVKLLFARASVRHCDGCDAPVQRRSPASVADELLSRPEGSKVVIAFEAPALDGDDWRDVSRELGRQGFTRLLHDGAFLRVDALDAALPGRALVALDRLSLEARGRTRLLDSLEQAFAHGAGRISVLSLDDQGQPAGDAQPFDLALRCDACGIDYPEPSPGHFTFNNPLGACPDCKGFGRTIEISRNLVVPDPRLPLGKGAIKPWSTPKTTRERRALREFCADEGIALDLPWSELSEDERERIWTGEPGATRRKGWWGVLGWFRWLESKQYKMHVRVMLSRFRTYVTCETCRGERFRPETLRHFLDGRSIAELYRLSIGDCRAFFEQLSLPPALAEATAPVLEEVRARLRYLHEVGLDYLTLARQSRTLSGGEMQRVNLTTAVGSSLTGALFVLDEPSVGLHPRDNDRLAAVLNRLVAQGNTAVVVEHDPALIRAADWLVDMGPKAGAAGGELLYEGPVEGVERVAESATGRYLAGDLRIPLPESRRAPGPERLVVRGATAHELKGFDVEFPVGLLTCVTGVSGAGKSSLVEDVLHRNLLRARGVGVEEAGACEGVEGAELFEDIAFVDASPIGKSPKSTVGTYLKVHDRIRKLLAATDEAVAAGVDAGSFSFNRPGGRCETCEGAGFEKVEMQFLADVHVPCADCGGARFGPEALAVRIDGRNISDVLALSLDAAAEVFSGDAQLLARLAPAREVGLGYLELGQSVVTLSGGEAQRLKLAAAVAASQVRSKKRSRKKPRGNLYLFDEPSTGLAASDLEPLLRAFDLLVEAGHTLVVVEHSGEVIKRADWVIDLGPEAGAAGGELVAQGPPEEIAACEASITGRFLAPLLEDGASEADVVAAQPSADAQLEGVHDGSEIRVHGAHEHNLRSLDFEIEQGKFVVVTGPSGSGKSSLAFDILFAEGQRRYLETLSPYARQFLSPVAKPGVDRVDGLPPAIAIEQRRTRGGSKTTVATLTEAWHYLRLAWSKLGVPHCPDCDEALAVGTPAQVAAAIVERHGGKTVRLLAPVVIGRKGFHREVFEKLAKAGVGHCRVDGERVATEPTPGLSRYHEHDIDAEVAELKAPKRVTAALTELVTAGLSRGGGTLRVSCGGQESSFSSALRCPRCGVGVPEPEPRSFSFNSSRGWCPDCDGYGFLDDFEEQLLVPDPTLSIRDGALAVLDGPPFVKTGRARFAKQVRDELGVDPDKPWEKLGKRAREQVLAGTEEFTGLVERLHHFLEDGESEAVLSRYLASVECEDCSGSRLGPASRAVRVSGRSLPELAALSVEDARTWVASLRFRGLSAAVWEPIRRELLPKLEFLEQVGLGYLSLDRRGDTLSGGEAQRIRLAASLGSHLTGILYVLDEPTIGLHPVDGERLIGTLRDLRDLGNTVVVVEHDEDTIHAADWLIDLGPGAGTRGGEIVAQGEPAALAESADSSTALSLRGEGRGRRNKRKKPQGPWLEVKGATENNLQGVDARLPLGVMTCVTGVSGSGKSTLVREVLLPALQRRLHASSVRAGAHRGLSGWQAIERVAEVDQAPIGRNPRSTPATYIGIWDQVRKLFASSNEAKSRGYTPSRFSFNVRGGRCEKCEGQGVLKIEMSFLPDARVGCDACRGKRFNAETLEVRWKGRSIADVLDMPVEEAVEFFGAHPGIREPLEMAARTGLGYLTLGQPSPTLSGGEAQRIKLVEELGRRTQRPTLFVLDEPTTGLSLSDVSALIDVFHLLVEKGHTLVVIEHHLDVIAESDWLLDLGPGGGRHGGRLVAEGTPRALKRTGKDPSPTARCLKDWFSRWGRAATATRS